MTSLVSETQGTSRNTLLAGRVIRNSPFFQPWVPDIVIQHWDTQIAQPPHIKGRACAQRNATNNVTGPPKPWADKITLTLRNHPAEISSEWPESGTEPQQLGSKIVWTLKSVPTAKTQATAPESSCTCYSANSTNKVDVNQQYSENETLIKNLSMTRLDAWATGLCSPYYLSWIIFF